MGRTTLISSFWNEEFLLPFWVKHHLPIFDDAILFDYHSTDSSVDIVRTLAPHWKIIETKNDSYDAYDNDLEFMQAEETVEGWKMCLTTTEFLLCPDFRMLIDFLDERKFKKAVIALGTVLVDTENTLNDVIDPNIPLLRQKHFGFFSSAMGGYQSPFGQRDRIVHCLPNGQYKLGRHGTHIPVKDMSFATKVAYNVWCGWSPYKYIRERKLAIKRMVSERDMADPNRALHHKAGAEQLDAMFKERSAAAVDLFDDADYRYKVSRLPQSYV